MLGVDLRNQRFASRGRAMRMWAALSLALLPMGCASASDYSPESFFNGGYGETETQPNIWNVYYHGVGRIRFQVAETYWLRRCADIARSRGYTEFAVLRVSERRGNHSDPLVVEGTIRLLNTATVKDAHVVLDTAAIEAAVSAADACAATGPCTINFDAIPHARDIFPGRED